MCPWCQAPFYPFRCKTFDDSYPSWDTLGVYIFVDNSLTESRNLGLHCHPWRITRLWNSLGYFQSTARFCTVYQSFYPRFSMCFWTAWGNLIGFSINPRWFHSFRNLSWQLHTQPHKSRQTSQLCLYILWISWQHWLGSDLWFHSFSFSRNNGSVADVHPVTATGITHDRI